MKRYAFGISGASGATIAVKVVRELVKTSEVHLIISGTAFSIIHAETGIDLAGGSLPAAEKKLRRILRSRKIFLHGDVDFYAPVSSGSYWIDGMFVVPCSMKTLAGIAHGYADSLIERAADVTIKEGRPLVLSPRETPFSAIHLENMLKLARLGVRIVPPVMGFYHEPKSLDDVTSFAAGKILDAMQVGHSLYRRWGSESQ